MTKTELLNHLAIDGEERLLLARAHDQLETTRSRSIPAHTPFLSPEQQAAVSRLIAASGHPRNVLFGGYAGAERAVCVFLPDWMEDDAVFTGDACPVSALRAVFPAGSGLNHRDFLGALMGLGVTRESLGDILVTDGCCDLLLLRDLEPFLLTYLESAGRTRLKLSPIDLNALSVPEPSTTLLRDTVATLRLDAVVASAFSLPRSRAAELITSGRVRLNHRECGKPDRSVNQGDRFSCRGFGACVLKEVLGQSKKGRIIIVLERFQ
ncbi:MAG: RNA-binding protein [Oscillospiraceae bacterium]|nr:RNA-binding protein [Oscillospiraceae bacterium]